MNARMQILFLIFIILMLCGCTDKSIQISEQDKLSAMNKAIEDVAVKGYHDNISNRGCDYIWVIDNKTEFPTIKKAVNGVNISVLPIKVKSHAYYKYLTGHGNSGVLTKYNHKDTVSYRRSEIETTIHIYKNEVNDIKYDIVDNSYRITDSTVTKSPRWPKESCKKLTGKLSELNEQNATITIMNESGKELLIACIDPISLQFSENKVKVGDMVNAYYLDDGPRYCGFNYVYLMENMDTK